MWYRIILAANRCEIKLNLVRNKNIYYIKSKDGTLAGFTGFTERFSHIPAVDFLDKWPLITNFSESDWLLISNRTVNCPLVLKVHAIQLKEAQIWISFPLPTQESKIQFTSQTEGQLSRLLHSLLKWNFKRGKGFLRLHFKGGYQKANKRVDRSLDWLERKHSNENWTQTKLKVRNYANFFKEINKHIYITEWSLRI